MTKTYTRLQIAADQLRAAVGLFVASRDRFSVITLAGAADVILSQLVLNTGQENFTDSIIRMEVEKGGPERTRAEVGKAVNDMLLINALKHFNRGEDGTVEVGNLDETALAVILKAMANYVVLAGKKEDWVQAFFFWIRQNLDVKKYDPNWVEPKP
ncbi:hypothetical protein IAG25_31260 [Caballeronia sp. EK]|uniref:hypothetical protein n=1 Tax=Caballeronia sp. EK TaxID=2767469 RepID=UPI0016566ECE|nr:hypothetical protein [Caballeronia sp. EK]MBC8641301.1 hypothetical protein [Caballeronia sp. EK]